MELVRFFGVSAAGVFVDIGVAYGLAAVFHVPLWIAAVSGFLIAAILNYVLHEIWTFQAGAKTLSFMRALKYLASCVITLLSRIAVVFVLQEILPGNTLLILVGAAGGSFFVNFALSKLFVFSQNITDADTPV